MKKIFFFAIATTVFLPTVTFAQQYLVNLPINTQGNFDEYINLLYKMSISIAALLAVVKIIIAGAKYMLSDIVTTKGEAKKDIRGALLGLLLIIGAVIILNTINPALTDGGLNIRKIVVPALNVSPPVQTSVNQSAIDAAAFDDAARTAAANAATGGCNVRTNSETGDFKIITLDMTGCQAGFDPAPYFGAFSIECMGYGGVTALRLGGKLMTCSIAKASVVKSRFGTVAKTKTVWTKTVTFTTSSKVTTSNQTALVAECTDWYGTPKVLNAGTVNEAVTCNQPAVITYSGSQSQYAAGDCNDRVPKGVLYPSSSLKLGLGVDYYCVIR